MKLRGRGPDNPPMLFLLTKLLKLHYELKLGKKCNLKCVFGWLHDDYLNACWNFFFTLDRLRAPSAWKYFKKVDFSLYRQTIALSQNYTFFRVLAQIVNCLLLFCSLWNYASHGKYIPHYLTLNYSSYITWSWNCLLVQF